MFFERSFKKDFTTPYVWARLSIACSNSLGGADRGIVRAHFLKGFYVINSDDERKLGHVKFELDPTGGDHTVITMPAEGKWGETFLHLAAEWKWVDISWRRDRNDRISFRMYPSETFPKMYW